MRRRDVLYDYSTRSDYSMSATEASAFVFLDDPARETLALSV